MKPDAVIFDMDGTLMNNNPYHYKAWQAFYKEYHRSLTYDEYKKEISGRTAADTLQKFFGKNMTPDEITKYSNEKNFLYRKLYKTHIKPVDGLLPFLKAIHDACIPTCVATSGPPQNVRFMFEHIPIESYFNCVINDAGVMHGKPAPDVYLKAAVQLHAEPAKCIVFEDSVNGIAAAKAAGMKVVGVATTESRDALQHLTDVVINDYTEIDVAKLEKLLRK